VAETSIDELIQHTAQRKNRTMLWKFPELPVLCAFNANGAAVVSDKPAGNHQLTQIMSQAARAAGLMGQYHAHDLRHGAATETTNLKGKLKGMANKGATTRMSGRNASMTNTSTPSTRRKRPDKPYQRKFQMFKSQELTDTCVSEGLYSIARKDRTKASKILERRTTGGLDRARESQKANA
jgi:hypothetical protein